MARETSDASDVAGATPDAERFRSSVFRGSVVEPLPASYPSFLDHLKDRIRTARVGATRAVERELSGLDPESRSTACEELTSVARRRALRKALADQTCEYLLGLGVGFAFVGQQVHLEVGGQDFYVDLLFYHLRLRCFVVVELKAEPFQPEFSGKMNFYLAAVDDRMRHAEDRPSIGLILCKEHNRVIVEYALRDATRPIGVARWEMKSALPDEFTGVLRSPEQIATRLEKRSTEGEVVESERSGCP